jgi:hypothetical protein
MCRKSFTDLTEYGSVATDGPTDGLMLRHNGY